MADLKGVPFLVAIAILCSSALVHADDHIVVSWRTEAPDMTDVRDFNDAGSVSVTTDSNCGTAFRLVRVHAFDYFLGSSRGADRNPMRDRSSGIALTLQTSPTAHQSLVAVHIEAGQDDWHDDMRLSVPIYSPDQLESLAPEVTWVVPVEGFTWPRYWKTIRLECRERGA